MCVRIPNGEALQDTWANRTQAGMSAGCAFGFLYVSPFFQSRIVAMEVELDLAVMRIQFFRPGHDRLSCGVSKLGPFPQRGLQPTDFPSTKALPCVSGSFFAVPLMLEPMIRNPTDPRPHHGGRFYQTFRARRHQQTHGGF